MNGDGDPGRIQRAVENAVATEDEEEREGNDDLDAGPEHSLLRNSRANMSPSTTLSSMGRFRAYWLGMIVCIGGFLFGYDSGIIGGVLTFESYERDFRYTPAQATRVSSLAVALQQLGAFVACFAIWPVTHKLGRRYAIAICAAAFIAGVIIQTINTHSTAAFYAGRVVAGLGLGGSSVVVPMFSSEMVPKEIRGQVGSFYQLMYTLGIFTSYWIDWGVARDIPGTESRQWQIPIGLQMLFAGLLGLGMFTLEESTRWLTQKGRHDEAWVSLAWIRASEGDDVETEMYQIRTGVEVEAHAKEGFQFKEVFQPPTAPRTLTAALVFTAQQATGATAFAYFAPQYFNLLVGDGGNTDLLLTAIFGAIKVASCALFVVFVADTVPRRAVLTGGALFMAACQIACAAVVKTHPAPGDGTVTNAGVATVVLIFLFVIAYNFSWGPLPWPYVSEIFTTRTREPGVAVGVAAQWLFNFVFSLSTPYMIRDMGWGTFLLWGLFDLVIAGYAWYGLVETQGRSLEEIARVAVSAGDPRKGVEDNGDVR